MTSLQIVFVALAVALMLFWLVFVVRPPRKLELPNAIAVLRYGALLRIMGLGLALGPPTVMTFVVAVFAWRSDAMLTFAGIAFLVMSLIAGLLLIEVHAGQIYLTEDGVTRYSLWSGPTALRWADVVRVRFSALNRWFVVEGRERTLCVSSYLDGMPSFVETVRRKVAAERLVGAAAMLERLKRQSPSASEGPL
jgi:hypothetical protein